MNRLDCDDTLCRRMRANLDDFHADASGPDSVRRAAVALTVVEAGHGAEVYGLSRHDDWHTDAALVLTRRAAGLRHHSGQWALPGGRLEPGESPETAALRELDEEVGLALNPDRILGRLDDFATRSGFVITPVVVWGGPGAALTANPEEVASIHRIPVAEFLREDAPILYPQPESDHPVLLMPVGESWIAAPTAAMLYQFREVAIFGRQTRVAHFEQPYFAWK
ncbi:MAG: CoA pyrophosphatase [Desulfobacterales bacterium]|nr:CoA pyrophosphatase [Desulfobacterales bacterium]